MRLFGRKKQREPNLVSEVPKLSKIINAPAFVVAHSPFVWHILDASCKLQDLAWHQQGFVPPLFNLNDEGALLAIFEKGELKGIMYNNLCRDCGKPYTIAHLLSEGISPYHAQIEKIS